MTHEIDMSNNRANMAFVGQVPWHGLGQKLDPSTGIDQWKEAAGLNWEALTYPVTFNFNGMTREMDDRCVLFRSDTGEPLNVISNRYRIVQPGEVLEFFRDLVEEYGAFQLDTAGCLFGGGKIWALARSHPDSDIILDGDDVIQRYLLLATSYDFSCPTVVQQTSVRVVCSNTLQAARSETSSGAIRITHLQAFNPDRVKERLQLDENWKVFGDLLRAFSKKKVKKVQVASFFKELFFPQDTVWGQEASEEVVQKWTDQMTSIFETSPGSSIKSSKGTAMGLVNAITYYVDHVSRARTADSRLDKAWFGEGKTLKARALSLAADI